MVMIVMDMSTGKIDRLNSAEAAEEEFGAFVDEVLNAGWLPQPAARLEPHAVTDKHEHPVVDADEFLRTLYRSQE